MPAKLSTELGVAICSLGAMKDDRVSGLDTLGFDVAVSRSAGSMPICQIRSSSSSSSLAARLSRSEQSGGGVSTGTRVSARGSMGLGILNLEVGGALGGVMVSSVSPLNGGVKPSQLTAHASLLTTLLFFLPQQQLACFLGCHVARVPESSGWIPSKLGVDKVHWPCKAYI